MHVRVRVQSEGAARQFSVISVPYASAYETGSFDYMRVYKPDGTKVETPTADAIEMPAAVTREAPLYSDLKEKQLPVRSLSAGDTIEYVLHTVQKKAEAPGQFWGGEHFLAEGSVVLSQTLTLEVPTEKYVQVWDPNHPAQSTDRDGVRTYRWTTAQLKATGKGKDGVDPKKEKLHDPDEDADGRKLPSVTWTTFHSWGEVGEWYRSLSRSRSEPTYAIRKRADELTKDIGLPEEQVRAIYDFVAKQTRYVGIDFGIGRYEPHTAEEVMDHQYGDCKDKDTLLEALLRAKGFVTAPALIGVNVATVADAPSPAMFNHVITTVDLPSGRIWLDATPEVEPYRVLVPMIRDQQALVIPSTGAASLQRTPADPPFAYFERFEANGTLDKNGLLESHMDLLARSDNEFGYRILLQRAAPSQWNEALQYLSQAMGFGGTVSHADLKQGNSKGPVHLTYDYSRPNFGDWDNHRILPLFPMLEVTTIDKDEAPEHDIDQGAPRTLEAVTHIKLPEGYRADLPNSVHVKRPYATFDQTYSLDGRDLLIERTVVVTKKKVAKADWKDYRAYLKEIGAESGENYISLIPPVPKVVTTAQSDATATKPVKADATSSPDIGALTADALAQMVREAGQMEQAGDWSGAREKLAKIKAARPGFPYVQSMMGFLDMRDHKVDEAIAEFKAELQAHPDADEEIVVLLAAAYSTKNDNRSALTLLQTYAGRGDVRVNGALAAVQKQMGDEAGALATLQATLAAHPEDRSLQTRLAEALQHMHRNTEAVAAAKAAMDGSDDPNTLNSNAYLLSELKAELPLAEKSARRAVELLETASSQSTVGEANSSAFQRTNVLVATWDTLGWIFFLEGKPSEAEPYLAAAWFNEPNLVVGDHLAQVQEALGKNSEALKLEELAMATDGAAKQTEVMASVKQRAERLRSSGAKSPGGDARAALQRMRTFAVKRPPDLKGWGTFRVQLASSGVRESNLVQGSPTLRPMTAELNGLEIGHAVPSGSKARLVRDGVLSCSSGATTCDFVLMPQSSLQAEAVE